MPLVTSHTATTMTSIVKTLTGPGARRKCRIQRRRVVLVGHSLASLERFLRLLRGLPSPVRWYTERETKVNPCHWKL